MEPVCSSTMFPDSILNVSFWSFKFGSYTAVEPMAPASVELNALNSESVSGVRNITMSWPPHRVVDNRDRLEQRDGIGHPGTYQSMPTTRSIAGSLLSIWPENRNGLLSRSP